MAGRSFDPVKLDDPGRLDDIRPGAIWDALGSPSASALVDLGAGTGIFAEAFAGLAPDAVVYAADVSERMLDWLREKRSALVGEGRVVPLLIEDGRVPLPDGAVDAVVSINLHHELSDPLASYREAMRLLRAGGGIAVVDWAPRPSPKGPPVATRPTPEEIAGALSTAGFADVRAHDVLPYHSLVVGWRPRGD